MSVRVQVAPPRVEECWGERSKSEGVVVWDPLEWHRRAIIVVSLQMKRHVTSDKNIFEIH